MTNTQLPWLSIKLFRKIKKQLLIACLIAVLVLPYLLWKPEDPISKAIMTPTFLNLSQKVIHNYASNPKGIPLLLLFTTFKPSFSKSHIYENTLRNWALLRPAVQPLMFYGKDLKSHWKDLLKKLGWALLPIPKNAKFTTLDWPILPFMFEAAIDNFPAHHYGFSNGDILFDESLVLTLEALYQHPVVEDFLMIGRRINFNLDTGTMLHSLAEVRQFSQRDKATIFIKEAQDYFITTKHAFIWDDIPNFVIGRVGYDNWLVSHAIQNGPLVIDASNTVLCMHQTGQDGDYSGSKAKELRNFNLELAGDKFDYSLGKTDCAQWKTVFSSKLKAVVLSKRSTKYCYGHRHTYFEHQDVDIPKDS